VCIFIIEIFYSLHSISSFSLLLNLYNFICNHSPLLINVYIFIQFYHKIMPKKEKGTYFESSDKKYPKVDLPKWMLEEEE